MIVSQALNSFIEYQKVNSKANTVRNDMFVLIRFQNESNILLEIQTSFFIQYLPVGNLKYFDFKCKRSMMIPTNATEKFKTPYEKL